MHFIPFEFVDNKVEKQRNVLKLQQNQQKQRRGENKIIKNSKNFNSMKFYSSVAILIFLITNDISKTDAVPTDSISITGEHTTLLQRAVQDVTNVANLLHQQQQQQEEQQSKAAAQQELQKQPDSELESQQLVSHFTIAAIISTEMTVLQHPQGQCLLDGVFVPVTSVSCETKVGCRAIQKTGHCCPDYKCDCEKDGKTYSNGDKLVNPETPCTVCRCQGGQIVCNSVTCFHRDDCTPKYIPGRCCPEYDNCPVTITESSTNGVIVGNSTATSRPNPQPAAALNPKITIKEITKPIEIRITDDNKGIPIHQMLKPSTTTTTTTTTELPIILSSTTTIEIDSNSPFSPTSTDESSTNFESNDNDSSQKASNSPTIPLAVNNNESLKLSVSVPFSTQQTKLLDNVASVATQNVSVPSPNSYAVTDEIVMVKNDDGDEKPIAVFGTQGLQRVDGESGNDPSKVNKREYLITTEGVPLSSITLTSPDLETSDLIYTNVDPITTGNNVGQLEQVTSAEVSELDTAGSDNIYHIILTTDGPRFVSTTDHYLVLKGINDTEVIEPELSLESHNNPQSVLAEFGTESKYNPYTEGPDVQSSSTLLSSESIPTPELTTKSLENTTVRLESSTAVYIKPLTEGQHSEDDEIATPMESNPAYPSLPEDDFSLRDVNFPLSEIDDVSEHDLKDESRSIGTTYDSVKSTKHLDDESDLEPVMEGSGSGSGTGSFVDSYISSSLGEYNPGSTTEAVHPAKVQLMYSAEEGSEEASIANTTVFQMDKYIQHEVENETGSGDSLESADSLESLLENGSDNGSGNGKEYSTSFFSKSKKQREPTTPRPTRASDLDIDDLDASGAGRLEPIEDPKLDAESLKAEENGNDKQDTATKSSVLSVKTYPTKDRTLEEELHSHGLISKEDDDNFGRVQRSILQRIV